MNNNQSLPKIQNSKYIIPKIETKLRGKKITALKIYNKLVATLSLRNEMVINFKKEQSSFHTGRSDLRVVRHVSIMKPKNHATQNLDFHITFNLLKSGVRFAKSLSAEFPINNLEKRHSGAPKALHIYYNINVSTLELTNENRANGNFHDINRYAPIVRDLLHNDTQNLVEKVRTLVQIVRRNFAKDEKIEAYSYVNLMKTLRSKMHTLKRKIVEFKEANDFKIHSEIAPILEEIINIDGYFRKQNMKKQDRYFSYFNSIGNLNAEEKRIIYYLISKSRISSNGKLQIKQIL